MQQVWQVADMQIFYKFFARVQQSGRGAGPRRPRCDQPFGQLEIEVIQFHCASSGGGRRKISRKMPGVKTDSGLTDTALFSGVPVRR